MFGLVLSGDISYVLKNTSLHRDGKHLRYVQPLVDAFKDYVAGSERAFLMSIEDERVVPKGVVAGSGDLRRDLDLLQNAVADQAVYLVVRNDDISGKFIFISFVLDNAPVRSKMLYASTKNTVIRQLGVEFFYPIVFINDKDELSGDAYETLLGTEGAKPLSSSEESLAAVKQMELLNGGGIERRKQQLVGTGSSGLNMSVDGHLLDNLRRLDTGQTATIVISGDEQFRVDGTATATGLGDIASTIPTHSPTYTVARFGNGYYFVYCCPSGSRVRDRMVYASSKQGLLNDLKSGGIDFIKVVEVGDPDEIVADERPLPAPAAQTFHKPRGPRRR
ncbi:hypothetical protein KL936_000629 [Ogataea polymorpha]|nr:hypothetical protein KL936_000629 [Ogataea polymorpha]